jgi:hypothetical protein
MAFDGSIAAPFGPAPTDCRQGPVAQEYAWGVTDERRGSTDAAADCIRRCPGWFSDRPLGVSDRPQGQPGAGRGAAGAPRRGHRGRRDSHAAAGSSHRRLPTRIICVSNRAAGPQKVPAAKILAPTSGWGTTFRGRRASLELIIHGQLAQEHHHTVLRAMSSSRGSSVPYWSLLEKGSFNTVEILLLLVRQRACISPPNPNNSQGLVVL